MKSESDGERLERLFKDMDGLYERMIGAGGDKPPIKIACAAIAVIIDQLGKMEPYDQAMLIGTVEHFIVERWKSKNADH